MKRLWVDIETTGLTPSKYAIWQIAYAYNDGPIKVITMKPDNDQLIDEKALVIGGITEDELANFKPQREGYVQLLSDLDTYVDKFDKTDKLFIAGYNCERFDGPHLRMLFERQGNKYFGSYFWPASHDIMILASFCLAETRHLMYDFKLKSVAEALKINVESEKLHDASYDIHLTRLVYQELNKIISLQ